MPKPRNGKEAAGECLIWRFVSIVAVFPNVEILELRTHLPARAPPLYGAIRAKSNEQASDCNEQRRERKAKKKTRAFINMYTSSEPTNGPAWRHFFSPPNSSIAI